LATVIVEIEAKLGRMITGDQQRLLEAAVSKLGSEQVLAAIRATTGDPLAALRQAMKP
jgi:hypothetical protein